MQALPEIRGAVFGIISLIQLDGMPKRRRITLLHQPFSISIRTLERRRIPARIRHQFSIVLTLALAGLIVRRRMHLVGSVLAGRSAVVFGARTAEEDEVEGAHGGDAGGHDDDVDLDAVVHGGTSAYYSGRGG